MARHSPIVSTVRSMRVIEELVGSRGLSISELSKRSDMSRAHVWKIVAGLENAGYIRQLPRGEDYVLTFKLAALGLQHLERLPFLELCQPYLDALAEDTGELVQLALRESNGLRFVAKAEGGGQRVAVLSLLGHAVDLHATASGKAWLSTFSEERVAEILKGRKLIKLGPKTITSKMELGKELKAIHERGYALNAEEDLEGVHAIAVPIPAKEDEESPGAIAVTAPIFRVPQEKLVRFVPRVVQAAVHISELLGDNDVGLSASASRSTP